MFDKIGDAIRHLKLSWHIDILVSSAREARATPAYLGSHLPHTQGVV